MPSWTYPNIASNLFDPNDICAYCGTKLAAVDRVEKKLATACLNRSCRHRQCLCVDSLKRGKESEECMVHWKCDCRNGFLCPEHRLRPEIVSKRSKVKGPEWCDFTGFAIINNQVQIWTNATKAQEEKALAHCGNCFSVLTKTLNKAGQRTCPKDCKCLCGTTKACHVHFTCGCLDGGLDLCQFHETKKPKILVSLYWSLPATKLRSKLSNKLVRSNIDISSHVRRGRHPKELDIRELVRLAQPGKISSTKPSATVIAKSESATIALMYKPKVNESKGSPEKAPTLKDDKKFDLAADFHAKLPGYKIWLDKQGLSIHSVRNYLSRINAIARLINELGHDYPPLSQSTKDMLARDIKKHLQKTVKLKPATLNSYLAALDNFYGFLGIGRTSVVREDLPQEAPHALTPADQKKFLRAIELTPRSKDRAIATLLFYTGMRLSECAALDLDDVFVVGRKARVVIRSGKGGRYREIPLNSLVCEVIQVWLSERSTKYSGKSIPPAVFLNPQGVRMLNNSFYEIIRKIGRDANLELSPHTLRHTCLTALVRKQNDVVLVADIAGHKSLNTTRRYTLPSATDKAKALEQLLE